MALGAATLIVGGAAVSPAGEPSDLQRSQASSEATGKFDHEFVGELLRALENDQNYSGEWLDEEERILTLFGTSEEPSSSVTAIIERAPAGFSVRWAKAEHSEQELTDAAAVIWQSSVRVEAIRYAYDGSGITVSYVPDGASDPETALSASLGMKSKIPDSVLSIVRWEPVGENFVAPADTRTTDTSPFDGGSRIAQGSVGC